MRTFATVLIVLVGFVSISAQTSNETQGSNDPVSTPGLGPVAELVLQSSQGALKLKHADGRLAWNDGPWGKARSIATLDLGRVIMALAKSGQMDPDLKALRDELEKEYREGLDDRRRKLQDLERDIAAAPSRSSEQAELMRRRQETLAERSQWTKEIEKRRFEVAADILRNAYSDVRSAVDVIAIRSSIDIVLTLHDPDAVERLGYEDLAGFMKSHSVIRAPAEIDITDDVISELGIMGE